MARRWIIFALLSGGALPVELFYPCQPRGDSNGGIREIVSASGLVIIVFTDLVAFTELTSEIGDVAADELRRDHFVDLRGAIESTDGSEVKTIGDAIMASYTSAADALAGSVAMQRSIELRNRRSERPRLSMRVGVSAGDAAFEDGDWFGTPVIEASRLCAVADGGQILISDLV